ncbi:hypothetical protein [Devosia sp. 2618]
MKHDNSLPYALALPDAPLAMPKQKLERSNGVFSVLRRKLIALSWF